MSKIFIGLDNGVTGSIGIIQPEVYSFMKTPVFSELNYTNSKKQNITRIHYKRLKELFASAGEPRMVIIERPMVNPTRFMASASALRAFEATLICIQELSYPFEVIDSRKWQSELLPKGCKGQELKTASMQIASQMWPEFTDGIHKHGDGDGLLIAEYARRHYA
jgi:hypothetical protein